MRNRASESLQISRGCSQRLLVVIYLTWTHRWQFLSTHSSKLQENGKTRKIKDVFWLFWFIWVFILGGLGWLDMFYSGKAFHLGKFLISGHLAYPSCSWPDNGTRFYWWKWPMTGECPGWTWWVHAGYHLGWTWLTLWASTKLGIHGKEKQGGSVWACKE